jgi:hypothetical protein
MDKRYRPSLLIWVGSIFVALVIIGSLAFGAYQLYALGWAQGNAAAKQDTGTGAPQVPPPALMKYRYHRGFVSPFLLLLLFIIVFGTFVRQSAWRMHTRRTGIRFGPAIWARHCHYPGYRDCEDTPTQDNEDEDKEGAV